jgi:hypothetical protein
MSGGELKKRRKRRAWNREVRETVKIRNMILTSTDPKARDFAWWGFRVVMKAKRRVMGMKK